MATGNRRTEGRDGSRAVRDAVTVVALLAVVTTLSVSVETAPTPDRTTNAEPAPASVGIPEAIAAQPATATGVEANSAAPSPTPVVRARRDTRAIVREQVREVVDHVVREERLDPRVVSDVVRSLCAEDGRCEMRIGDVHVVVDIPNLG